MHELSICENLLSVIEDTAKAQNFDRVLQVRLAVGPFSGVETEALRFGFDVVMKGSLADGAILEINETQATAICLDCNANTYVKDRLALCPHCGSFRLKITGGKELKIIDLEVE
ncbi:MAG: hydrogenase maturation nickel metallochaperone HypA [Alphaproteobacteria bacterium]|jgi:hydrogenase nickel incorporation protein HypA/HybF